MKIALVHNVSSNSIQPWVKALTKRKIHFKEIKLSDATWFDQLISEKFDLVIARPNGTLSYQKQLFDERIYVIKHALGLPVYPKYNELFIYENKRMLSYWLSANNIPHPKTRVFYDYGEAATFVKDSPFPLVAKANIGASGSGIHILNNKSQARKLIHKAFKGSGLPRRGGPNFVRKGVYKRIISKITDFAFLKQKLAYYKSVQDDKDRRSIILQEFIPHNYEWKNVRIGNSFFSHKKMLVKGKASGGYKNFSTPPVSLLDFVKNVSDVLNFSTVSIDVFENKNKGYLVNEIQTYFGQPLPYLMKIDNKIGRYRWHNNQWVFEEGDFNTNESYDLRLEHALELYKNNLL